MYVEQSSRLALFVFWLVLLGAALSPFLFFGRIFIDGDVVLYYYPVFDFYHQAILSRASFLWNPSIFLGFPTYLSQSAGFFDPVNWILFHLPTFTAYHLRLALDLLLVLMFSYGVGRELNRSRLASLLIGMGYIIAFNWRYLSNVVISNSLFLLPFLFYAGLRLFKAQTERQRWLWISLMGVATGWAFISGYAQFTIYTLFVFGIFYIWYFFSILPVEKNIRTICRWTSYGIAIVAIGFVIGLPAILPALTFTPLTVRSEGVSYELATYKTVEPGDTLLFVFPDYLYFPYLSSGRKPLYVGALLFLLALVGMRELFRRRVGDGRVSNDVRIMRVFMVFLFFCFITSLKWSPVYYLMQKLPVFDLFRFPYRWMYLGAWFLACLGAYGFDFVRTNPLSSFIKRFSSVLVICVTALTSVILIVNVLGRNAWVFLKDGIQILLSSTVYGHFGLYKDPTHYRDALDRGIQAWRDTLSLSVPAFYLPFLILLFSIGLLCFVSRGRISSKNFSIIGFVLSVVTFLTVFMVQWPNTRSIDATLHNPIVKALPDLQTGQYRYMPFMLSQGLQSYIPPQYTLSTEEVQGTAELQFSSGWPNMNQYAGIASVDGYDPFVPVRLLNVLNLIGSTHGGEDATRSLTTPEITARLLGHLDIVGAMSGKYIISGVPLTHKNLHLIRIVPVSRYRVPLYLYENALALPRIYFAQATVNRENKSMVQLSEEYPNFKRETYLDCSVCVSHKSNQSDVLEVIRDENGMIELRTQTNGSRWLIIGDSNLPGWEAAVSGSTVPIVLANGLQMAVEVPAGDHSVVLTYVGVLHELSALKFLGVVK
jgi:hypothetical protein